MSRLLALALGLLAAVGCVTETGNPELQLSLEGHSSRADVQLEPLRSAAGPLTVDQAWIHIEDIRLVEGEVCDRPGEIEHDLRGGAAPLTGPPEIWTRPVPGSDVCRIRIDLDASDGDGPEELVDRTAWVRGRLPDGTAFEIASSHKATLDLRSRGEPLALGDAVESVVLAFDVGSWLADLPLETAERVGGIVLVDEDTNADLLAVFEAALETSVEAFDDPDADGRADLDDEPIAD